MYYGLISSMNKTSVASSYLLDTYVGASVGFDFRKISSIATKCIRIRRSNDNAEIDIGFSGNIIDTLAITTFVGSNSAYVVKWYDQSGNGYDLSQTNASIQPRIVNAGTIYTQNGKVSMEWTIEGTHLVSSYYFPQVSTANAFFVFKNTRVVSDFPYALDMSVNRTVLYFGPNLAIFNGLQVNSTYNGNDFNIISCLFNQNSSTLRKNNTQIASGNIGTDKQTGYLFLGSRNTATQSMLGAMSSFIMYRSNQSSNESSIETEINNYYGIY